MAIPLSVLDLAPIVSGSNAGEALRNSLELARLADRLGFKRYWVAEHHNMPGIASSSPAVLIGHIASLTERLRVGSGGVMLPNHAPLVIAEQFGMLEAIHPGRIDLGIGRAPGTDQNTARALRRTAAPMSEDDFLSQLGELVGFFAGNFPPEHAYSRIIAVPGLGNLPAMWLLGSSGYSAQLAGILGWPFAFAHHFSPHNTLPALEIYRRHFQTGRVLERPYVMVAVSVICAESAERARFLHGPSKLSRLRMVSGRPSTLPSPEEAAEYRYSAEEREVVEAWTSSHVVGDPEGVAAQLQQLVEQTSADELMITTVVHEHRDRLRSYELVAEMGERLAQGEGQAL